MKLSEMRVSDYLTLLASEAGAPGGGSASALSGAQGAALCSMVASLTIGKKKYADDQALCLEVQGAARALCAALTAQIDGDAEAFNAISDALALPKDSDEQKTVRRAALQQATVGATEAPLKTLGLAREALEQTLRLVGHSNRSCASDLGVAGDCLLACAEGAWRNVEINLSGLDDAALVADFRARGERELDRCRTLAAELR